ncbi:MAG: hemolysin III family protein [Burkholderiales bacterium]|nr:hemolysin III family protein [Burkholderiales bacterium]
MYYGERLNTATHLLGTVLAIAGSAALITKAAFSGDAFKIVSVSLFGASMIALYAASTLFHGSRGKLKALWAKADHCAIYLLISGTYMPFTLVTLRGAWGWVLFGLILAIAVVGIARELMSGESSPPSVPLYLAMGWLGLIASVPLVRHLSAGGLACLLLGALCYTVGVLFYWFDDRWRHAHGIWHMLVLAGTACHYFTVFYFVV